MRDVYDLTFWQNSASIHQAPLITALAADGLRVRVVVPSTDHPGRLAMGWQRPDYGGATLCATDDLGAVRTLAESARRDRAHVFTGLGSNHAVSTAFRALSAGPHNHLSVMTESWDPRGARGFLRRARYTRRALRWRPYIDSVLAIGRRAATQFASAGIPPERISDFIYSVSNSDRPLPMDRRVTDVPEIVFVGSLEVWKDPLLLIEAVSSLARVHLTMVGSGALWDAVQRKIARHGLDDRVRLIRRLDNVAVRSLLARSDLLVLPSQYDGWGAVTNEALMAGTPAVVSDGAGSSLLVADSDRGRIFRSRDVRSLTAAIREELACGPPTDARRERIRQWSEDRISPQAVARYLRDLLLHDAHAAPPWLEREGAE